MGTEFERVGLEPLVFSKIKYLDFTILVVGNFIIFSYFLINCLKMSFIYNLLDFLVFQFWHFYSQTLY